MDCLKPVSQAPPFTRGGIALCSPTLVVPRMWQTNSVPRILRCRNVSPSFKSTLAYITANGAEIPVQRGPRSSSEIICTHSPWEPGHARGHDTWVHRQMVFPPAIGAYSSLSKVRKVASASGLHGARVIFYTTRTTHEALALITNGVYLLHRGSSTISRTWLGLGLGLRRL